MIVLNKDFDDSSKLKKEETLMIQVGGRREYGINDSSWVSIR
jgi:hypothetical protein